MFCCCFNCNFLNNMKSVIWTICYETYKAYKAQYYKLPPQVWQDCVLWQPSELKTPVVHTTCFLILATSWHQHKNFLKNSIFPDFFLDSVTFPWLLYPQVWLPRANEVIPKDMGKMANIYDHYKTQSCTNVCNVWDILYRSLCIESHETSGGDY